MLTQRVAAHLSLFTLVAGSILLPPFNSVAQTPYEHEETRRLFTLMKDAADLVSVKGEAALADFCVSGSSGM